MPGVVVNGGYTCDGIAGYCYSSLTGSLTTGAIPFYSNGRDHFYTISATEIGTTVIGATGNAKYKYEGVSCYVNP
jgi:hypothetical protein